MRIWYLPIFAVILLGVGICVSYAFPRWSWEIAAQPFATVFAGLMALGAAFMAYDDARKRQRFDMQHSLNERFASIVAMIADSDNLQKRLAGVYALAGLANDWTEFYREDKHSIKIEYQKCVNIFAEQLRDEIVAPPDPNLLVFKQRVQELLFSSLGEDSKREPEDRLELDYDLQYCHLWNLNISDLSDAKSVWSFIDFRNCHFHGCANFSGLLFKEAVLVGNATFYGEVDFKSSCFDGLTDFSFVDFRDIADFHNARFNGSVDFSNAKFAHKKSFCNVYYGDGVKRDWVEDSSFVSCSDCAGDVR